MVTNNRFNIQAALTCQLTYYYGYVTSHASVWVLAAMSVEKAFIVLFPLKAKSYCTVKSAKIICTSIIVFWMVVHFQLFFTFKKHKIDDEISCNFDVEKVGETYPKFYAFIDNILYASLPSLVILVSNITIITRLVKAKLGSGFNNENSMSKATVNSSIMLLAISVTFMSLTIPCGITFVLYEAGYTQDQTVLQVSYLFYVLNHSINGIMLVLVAPKFRRAVKRFLGLDKGRVEPHSGGDTAHSEIRDASVTNIEGL